ncbi:MAG: tRNA pseudouridine(55) synthase TruB [Anaerolineales bacterium]|nr:tRNA pseudouridine(55) synthase TruB [Anaerolineales bacterium]
MYSGLLLIDKPTGPTSHDVVAAVRRGAKERQVGHAGTLDPLATGLLVVCMGQATRLSEYLLNKNKRYLAHVRFGQSTNTYDADGEITATSEIVPDRIAAEAALENFRGAIQQRPPAFSAIKRGGQKMYDLARRGEAVELEPRPVTVHHLEIMEWTPPICVLDVLVSAGTYIRSLAHDLGQVLGCGAHLAALRRTQSGPMRLEEAVTLETLQAEFAAGTWAARLKSPALAVPDWPSVALSAEEARRVQNGQFLPLASDIPAGTLARAYTATNDFFAVLAADTQRRVWRPEKVFSA